MKKKILVFGSFVADLMSRGPHLPSPGETVLCSLFQMGPGGKGFNQGVAAHKAGGDVTMVTKIGRDAFGDLARSTMQSLGMDTAHLLVSDTVGTGAALVFVDETTSQNMIGITPGACATITEEDLCALEPVLAQSSYLLMQMEVNLEANWRLLRLAKQHGVMTILNTAPAQPLPDEIYRQLDMVTPNEVEAELLTGVPVADEAGAQRAADALIAKGVKNAVITLGSRGVFVATAERAALIPVPRVEVLDTTGAGDAFNGGLVTALSEGKDLFAAAKFANALAAVSVRRMGTTNSMPTREEIDAFIAAHPELA